MRNPFTITSSICNPRWPCLETFILCSFSVVANFSNKVSAKNILSITRYITVGLCTTWSYLKVHYVSR